MRAVGRYAVLCAILAIVVVSVFVPATAVKALPAAKQITITITEAQLNKYLPTVKPRDVTGIEADIIDGGIIIKLTIDDPFLPEYREHYGILNRENKISVEAGVFDIPGLGALGYEDIKQLIPELVPQLDHNAKVLNKYVNKQVSAKAGTRYTIDSITIGNDEVVIVVTK